MNEKHKCKTLVISCIDFRFVSRVRNFLVEQGLTDDYDSVTVPGASLGIEKLSEPIATSINLHEPSEIYIFDHEDCGAYGENNSLETHISNLKDAKEMLGKKYPNKLIKIFFVGFDMIKEIT